MSVSTSVVRSTPRSIPKNPSRAPAPAPQTWSAKPATISQPAPIWLPGLRLPNLRRLVGFVPPESAGKVSGSAQQQALWKEVERGAYRALPDGVQPADADSWLHSNQHPPMARLRTAATSSLGLPLQMFQVGNYYGGTLIGVATGLAGLGLAPVMTAYMAAHQAQHLLRTPRVMTARAEFKAESNTPFSGLFHSGGKALVTLVSGRCGPYIRLDLFVDGHAPIVLRSNKTWDNNALLPVAEVDAQGKAEASVKAPAAMDLEFRVWPYWEPTDDWRQAVHDHFKDGALLYKVMGTDPQTHQEVALGELRLTSQFIASAFADMHLQ